MNSFLSGLVRGGRLGSRGGGDEEEENSVNSSSSSTSSEENRSLAPAGGAERDSDGSSQARKDKGERGGAFISACELYAATVERQCLLKGGVEQNAALLLASRERYSPMSRAGMRCLFNKYRVNQLHGDPLICSRSRVFCGKFSRSGDCYMTASQDSAIRLYDAKLVNQWGERSPTFGGSDSDNEVVEVSRRRRGAQHHSGPTRATARRDLLKPSKIIGCHDVGWSVISTDFSPDEKWVAYSSWSRYVHICNTFGSREKHEAMDFLEDGEHYSFCLFSIQFSPNSTHLLGGSSDHATYLYNLERKAVVARLQEHADDVNAVAYTDASGHTLVSGSDDCLIKVWDARNNSLQSVGTLAGHTGGVTCLSVKGNGHHIISNSKDQTCKLWDIRQMRSADQSAPSHRSNWDYRSGMTPRPRDLLALRYRKKIKDLSLQTYTGHRVLQTLIKCDFSPEHTTGQRFVYSGSQDGHVYMWDTLTGERFVLEGQHSDLVREVSWHPHLPLLASASWDGTVGLWHSSGSGSPH